MVHLMLSLAKPQLIFSAVVLILWSPHLHDYVLQDATGHIYVLNFGQHIGFFLSLLCGAFLLVVSKKDNLRQLFKDRLLVLLLMGVAIHVCIFADTIWNIRVAAIISIFISLNVIAASAVVSMSECSRLKILKWIIIPVALPVLGSVFLFFFEPLNVGIILENTKHTVTNVGRWHFLNSSANGFGLDASIFSITIYCVMRNTETWVKRSIFIILLAVGLVAVYSSGTRAAGLILLVGILGFEVFSGNLKLFLLLAMFVLGAVILLISVVGINEFMQMIRMKGDIVIQSTGRMNAWYWVLDKVSENIFSGAGFGASDNGGEVRLGGITAYLSLVYELGMVGAICTVVIMIMPLMYGLNLLIKNKTFKSDSNNNNLIPWAMSLLCSFLVYIIFENVIPRYSYSTGLFAFCWGYYMLYLVDNSNANDFDSRNSIK